MSCSRIALLGRPLRRRSQATERFARSSSARRRAIPDARSSRSKVSRAIRAAGTHGGRRVKVLAAMSGGVDSSVAAARAVDAGHEVVGVHLALSAQPGTLRTGARGCCTKEDAADARRVADNIDIPFYVWDFA